MSKELLLNGGCCSHPQVSSCDSRASAVSCRGFLSTAGFAALKEVNYAARKAGFELVAI
jgi:hypothetical protein